MNIPTNFALKRGPELALEGLYRKLDAPFPFNEILLSEANDEQLKALAIESGTGLSLDEMKALVDYFALQGRNPTEVELQSIGQAWSEHCCYKSSKQILKEFVFGIDNPQVIDRGDAGVMEFDENNAYSLRIESHNHPSAVEPYGGAATGIGGIVRDVLCMGCQPIALIDPLFFGNLDTPMDKLPKGTKHPRYLFSGVVSGIRDYGNRIGVPTLSGGVFFDESYTGNCLVNVGCVGIASKSHLYKNRVGGVGDNLVLVGGRTGRDGIHGVTFASAVLTKKSETESRGAVQLGDPITKEPVIHAVLEVARRGIISGMKDLGGGGLSCVCGELAYAAGFGVEVQLDKVPTKEDGLLPWEIWVSESQERMMLAVTDENLEEVLHVFKFNDVEATVVGRVIPEQVARVFFNGVKILDMELKFLTGGPEYCRPREIRKPEQKVGENPPKEPADYTKPLLELLASQNICSRDWVIRQYDHEVRGNTVLKPLQGVLGHACHGDASVLKPVEDSWKGLAITTAVNPWVMAIDPYRGGKGVIDEMCRNLVAVGSRPHSFSNCLNFGNPEKPERLGEFYEALKGLGEAAARLNIPTPSGNVSFYNESESTSVMPTAVLLGVGIHPDVRKSITSDLKAQGNLIYLVGKTGAEMGGSAFYRLAGGTSSQVPDTDIPMLAKSMDAMLQAMGKGFVHSCHDISDGGLGVAISEMCIGGQLGAELDLGAMGSLPSTSKLFAESNTRWLGEVQPKDASEFESLFKEITITKLGEVSGSDLVICSGEELLVDTRISDLENAWRHTLWKQMGGSE
ncbi:MAG: phosphoribosylformylglycinamidine synthase subunit PurL [Thermoplasmata archaeon]|nr:phosphoribosylformylglycinamidine synthase subunit PurL [Thermoplasmata archaeon]